MVGMEQPISKMPRAAALILKRHAFARSLSCSIQSQRRTAHYDAHGTLRKPAPLFLIVGLSNVIVAESRRSARRISC